MKKLFNFFAAAALVGGLMMTQSCSKTCDPGYEGSDCKTLSRDKVVTSTGTSTFVVTNNSCAASLSSTWNLTITPSSTDKTKFSISNFSHLNCSSNIVVDGTINGNTITLPAKSGICADRNLVSGSGTVTVTTVGGVSATTVSLSYTLDSAGQNPHTCTETWTKY